MITECNEYMFPERACRNLMYVTIKKQYDDIKLKPG